MDDVRHLGRARHSRDPVDEFCFVRMGRERLDVSHRTLHVDELAEDAHGRRPFDQKLSASAGGLMSDEDDRALRLG